MNSKLITMKSIDPMTLFTGVFADSFCLATNSLVPITVEPEYFKLEKFQTLQDVIETYNKLGGLYWPTLLGLNCLGQFSARRHVDVFVIARSDIVFRVATSDEANYDFQNFGEQVMGDECTDKTKLMNMETTINFMNKSYIYTGPLRFCNATLTARIISRTGVPNELEFEAIKKEIDSNYGEPNNSFLQEYFVLTAKKSHNNSAKLKILTFNADDAFDSEKFEFLGSVKAIEESKELWFYPEDNIDKKIDFSINFWRE